MIAQCPDCETTFQVENSELALANGLVRCGSCYAVFDAKANKVPSSDVAIDDEFDAVEQQINLIASNRTSSTTHNESDLDYQASSIVSQEESFKDFDLTVNKPEHFTTTDSLFGEDWQALGPQGSSKQQTDKQQANSKKTNNQKTDNKKSRSKLDEDIADFFTSNDKVSHQGSGARAMDNLNQAASYNYGDMNSHTANHAASALDDEPIVIKESKRFSIKKYWAYLAGAFGVICLGIILYISSQADYYGENLKLRPFIAPICNVTGCTLPPLYNTKYLKVTSLSTRDDPIEAGKLEVNAVIYNVHSIPMPFPTLNMDFASINGQPIERISVEPKEYLKGELVDKQMLPNNASAHLEFSIQDPGADAVNYTLKFEYPQQSLSSK